MPRKQWIDFAAVRAALPFSTVLSHYNIDHPDNQAQFKILCPLHTEKSPSCSINTERGIFQCFGCQAKGNVLDFIILKSGGDPANHADRYKAAELGISVLGAEPSSFGRGTTPPPADKTEDPAEPVCQKKEPGSAPAAKKDEEETTENPVFDRVLKLTHDHPFLRDRDIPPELAEKYGIGFCPKGIMKDRIAIPIQNANGEPVGYVGRWAEEDVPEDTERYKFPKGFLKSLELWNLHRALTLNKRFIVLVEGYWSTIRLQELGIPAAALMGTSCSETQAQLIRACGIRYAIQLMDGDEAGYTAANTNAYVLSQHVYTRTVLLPEGEKPDSVPASFLEQFM